jgi:hypothetical protein
LGRDWANRADWSGPHAGKEKGKEKRKGKWAARVSAQNSLGKKSFSIFKMISEFSTQFEFESNSNYERLLLIE